MRNPEDVLNQLALNACKPNYRYQRLYRNLFNPKFYLMAYSRIYAAPGNMTPGTDGKTIDGMSMERINALIESMKDCSYQPQPARRTYIPKKNGKTRPLGIPSFEDKLVQEVIRLILEAIWEPTFLDCSHGFRPDRSCHTALTQVHDTFTNTRWFVEGDIRGCFDNVDHHVLIDLVRQKVDDERFIGLLWKFLNAGYMESWKYHNTYSGTPQGSLISPILANIYLHELDKHMVELAADFNQGERRRGNPEYAYYSQKIRRKSRSLEKHRDKLSEEQIAARITEIHQLKMERVKLPSKDPTDPDFRRLRYVRYADDFLISIIGPKSDAEKIKEEVGEFLKTRLHLEMSEEKTLITHGQDKARFLGYDITTSYSQTTKVDKNGVRRRSFSGAIDLYVPKEAWVNRLKDYGALKIKMVDGKEVYKPVHRPYMLRLDDLEILSQYNAEIRGLYNYYRLAVNVCVLSKFMYVMKYSMYKTFANKYRTSIAKIVARYRDGDDFAVKYETKKGPRKAVLYNKGFARNPDVSMADPDKIARTLYTASRTSLIARLNAGKCEWCGKETGDLEVHHVRKLKDLKGKAKWERAMIERNRKTIVLCRHCHRQLHAGKLD